MLLSFLKAARYAETLKIYKELAYPNKPYEASAVFSPA